ncbi:MAG: MATE family efflux transporter [Clostridiales bacterium]|nr:MATE family efflux transporter [Clostridiales bacterium]
MENDYLIKKKPLNALIIFVLPIIIGNLFQQTYTMADSAIVGRFVGEQALAAVGASYSLTNIFIWVAIGGGTGASVIVSQYFGAKRYPEMKLAAYTALLSFLIISLIGAAIGLLFGRQIMVWLNTPDDVLDLASTYLNIYFMGLPFLFMYNVLSAMFNALGKSKIPLCFLIFSSVFNIILDYYTVTVLEMGVAGVAWATLIAQGIAAVLSFLVFMRLLRKIGGKSSGIFSPAEFFSMAKIALPSILQQSTVSIGMMLVQSVVNSFGSLVIAGFSAAMRIDSLCIVPMSSMSNAMSSYTAQNIGAGEYDRVVEGYHAANWVIVFFAVIICIILQLFNVQIMTLFLGEDGTAVAMQTGCDYISYMGWFFCLIGFKMAVDGLLRGAGDMKMFTIANLVNLSIRVILSITLAPKVGVAMVWYAVPIGWAANWVISYAEYRTGKWRKIYKSNEA